ncbi:MAG: nickel pincer cofactor biosynthesis protein LarB [Granulosicoccus sp.]|nr:nickel pincer cofactor biosynthesis protein LarB [Granulosicoccus sp.]
MDWHRSARAGIPEVVFAESKCAQQLMDIAEQHIARSNTLFMTRVSADKARALAMHLPGKVHVHEQSCTVFIGEEPLTMGTHARVAIVAAGTSDMPVVTEIEQSLLYLGEDSRRYVDVGVAGLWRLTELADELSAYSVIVAVAGMEGALFSVLAGLVPAPVIAVPVSVGYGVGEGGHVALGSALSSCSPGIAVVNIDNGFGAAALAVKMLGAAITR